MQGTLRAEEEDTAGKAREKAHTSSAWSADQREAQCAQPVPMQPLSHTRHTVKCLPCCCKAGRA